MNDADFEAQQARVLRYFEWWRQAMGLSYWTIKHQWSREHGDGYDDGQPVAALTNATPHYLDSMIKWHLPTLADLEDDDVEQVVVHELVHVINSELETARKSNRGVAIERTATLTAKALRLTRDAARDETEDRVIASRRCAHCKEPIAPDDTSLSIPGRKGRWHERCSEHMPLHIMSVTSTGT